MPEWDRISVIISSAMSRSVLSNRSTGTHCFRNIGSG
jgi:hypothetical protein